MSDLSKENYDFQKIVVILGFTLLIVKSFAYFLTNSVAILTDALESIVNVIAGCVGLYALYLSTRPADKVHPFGHGRAELISSSIEGSMIAVAGTLVIYEAATNILNPKPISDLNIGLILIIGAAFANYVIGSIAVKKGKKNRSLALESSGKHLITDTLSSIGIIIGLATILIANSIGYDANWLDPVIALFFGSLIIISGIKVLKKSMDGIMDAADMELLEEIVSILNDNRSSNWIDIHNLRAVKHGNKIHVDMHVTLPLYMTLKDIDMEKCDIICAIDSKLGNSVDLMIMPESCYEFSCSHCTKACEFRKSKFINVIEWSVNALIQKNPHSCRNIITINTKDKGEF